MNAKYFKIQNLCLIILLLVGAMVWVLTHENVVTAGPYSDSQHGNTTSGVDRSSIDTQYSVYAVGHCAHCHEPHASIGGNEPLPNTGTSAGPDPALLFSEEETTCETCHDGAPVLADIYTQSNKAYRHPMHDYSGRHTLSKLEYGQNGAQFRGSNRHTECADCHNPHTIGYPGNEFHTYDTTTPANNNLVSNPLKGVWGVEPTSAPLWSPPTGYTELTTISGSEKEYQICFKCHSYYALQDSDGVTNFTGPSGDYITDQAMEFSPGNKSAHPVQVTASNQSGASSPRGLTAAQMNSPWDANVGNQTMYCCDCHGNDADSPVGPHGSDKKFMLKDYDGSKTRYYWPINPDSGKLWTLYDIYQDVKKPGYSDWENKLFCVNCHPIIDIAQGKFYNKVHGLGAHYQPTYTFNSVQYTGGPCVCCHIAVPHGGKRGRLILYSSDVAPYNYGGYMGVMEGFKKATGPMNYGTANCYFPDHPSGCDHHKKDDGGYDP